MSDAPLLVFCLPGYGAADLWVYFYFVGIVMRLGIAR
jgi:hypothetical protein